MTNGEHKQTEKKLCYSCKANSQERILLAAEYQGQQIYVCLACLPRLIHGAH